MKIKNAAKIFKGKFQREKTAAEIVEEDVIKPTEDKNLTPEERVEKQSEKIIKVLEEYPEHRELIMERVNKDSRILQGAIDKSAVKATESPEVPANIAAIIAKDASDDVTLHVLENSNLSQQEAIEVANTLENKEAQKEGACTLLVKLYNSLQTVERQDILADKIQKSLVGEELTDDVKRELYKLVAKNFAIMYHERNRAMSIYSMEKIIPLYEMMRVKMPQKIEQEYINLLREDEENKFDKDYVTDIFLERIALESSKEAKEKGNSVDLFSPTNLGNLTDKEIEKYLDYLEKYTPNITDLAKRNIGDKLKEQEKDVYTLDQFIATVRDLPDREMGRYLRILSNLSTKEMDTVAQCIESGLIGKLSEKKPKDRTKYLKAINGSIDRRKNKNMKEENVTKYKIASREDTPKVKKAEFKEIDR